MNPGFAGDQSVLLQVSQLQVFIPSVLGRVHAVNNVSFTLEKGKTLGIVGESGCGKSILCRAIPGLLPRGAAVSKQSKIIFNGQVLTRMSDKRLNTIRGRDIAMVFQDPMTALNPVMTVGRQIAEPLVHHLKISRAQALKKSVELMGSTGIPEPDLRLNHYPHQLSGGLRQRVAIAIALSCSPKLLIADEPTTALDVTVQAEILNRLDYLKQKKNMAMILVTHDLGVAAVRCQNIAVMYAGQFVETAETATLFSHMKMPYTRALFDSLPRMENQAHTFLPAIDGQPPSLVSPPAGCCYAPRCPNARKQCRKKPPVLHPETCNTHRVACWYPSAP